MNFALLHWRELTIMALGLVLAFSVHSCKEAHKETARIIAEDSVLAENAKRENERIRQHDKEESADALAKFKADNARLDSDTRIATIQCVRPRASRISSVPTTTTTATGTTPDSRADVSRETTFDPGPELDQLMREADKVVTQCNALAAWVLSTK